MSLPDQWLDKCDFVKRTPSGIDSATRQMKYSINHLLQDERCDLAHKTGRVAQQGPGGTVYTTIVTSILKIWPDSIDIVPDRDDQVVVNGDAYKVTDRQDFYDGATRTYRGSKLTMTRMQTATAEVVQPPAPEEPQPHPLV